MQLVILAAGEGKRMYPITKDIPKPMVPLLGKPKLKYTLSNLPGIIDEVILVVNYLEKQIRDFFGDEYTGRKITYVRQEKLDGTGGAIHACKDFLEGRFLVMMGDDIYAPEDVVKMVQYDLAILVYETKKVGRFGRVMENEDENFVGIFENRNFSLEDNNGEKVLVNAAMYSLNQEFFKHELVAVSDSEFGLPQTLAKMANKYEIKVVKTEKWFPMGKASDVQVAEEKLKEIMF